MFGDVVFVLEKDGRSEPSPCREHLTELFLHAHAEREALLIICERRRDENEPTTVQNARANEMLQRATTAAAAGTAQSLQFALEECKRGTAAVPRGCSEITSAHSLQARLTM